ncbi:WhiB family transcriptional regulator [Mycolicibacterium brisbanense]|uniref:Transcriptional regulator WhiB n=1 Tax=Mycolicibacterium brisbanense TaxID=146020 RepID=A0A100W6Q6_9MYCO|nr:WhiB family transcriptional regulator [Mycolicibacterium brisbanense]MCV7158006.1 WhiB family transcriptional regulator [Mycolicibacterium brisbanense]GAS92654.1 transcriptional regulatory protein [Mycolicibacterium brisbanense]
MSGIAGALTLNVAEDWMRRKACATEDADDWFPEEGDARKARLICVGCPVREECLAYAIEHDERFGIWGGLAPKQRARIKQGQAPTYRFLEPDERPCKRCSKDFKPAHGRNIYCSTACRKLSEADRYRKGSSTFEARPCKRCGAEFMPPHGLSTYCSPACRKAAEIDQRRAKRAGAA